MCPHVISKGNSQPLKCERLAKDKWGFCIKQSFCRVKGKYELTPEAQTCKIRRENANAEP